MQAVTRRQGSVAGRGATATRCRTIFNPQRRGIARAMDDKPAKPSKKPRFNFDDTASAFMTGVLEFIASDVISKAVEVAEDKTLIGRTALRAALRKGELAAALYGAPSGSMGGSCDVGSQATASGRASGPATTFGKSDTSDAGAGPAIVSAPAAATAVASVSAVVPPGRDTPRLQEAVGVNPPVTVAIGEAGGEVAASASAATAARSSSAVVAPAPGVSSPPSQARAVTVGIDGLPGSCVAEVSRAMVEFLRRSHKVRLPRKMAGGCDMLLPLLQA